MVRCFKKCVCFISMTGTANLVADDVGLREFRFIGSLRLSDCHTKQSDEYCNYYSRSNSLTAFTDTHCKIAPYHIRAIGFLKWRGAAAELSGLPEHVQQGASGECLTDRVLGEDVSFGPDHPPAAAEAALGQRHVGRDRDVALGTALDDPVIKLSNCSLAVN